MYLIVLCLMCKRRYLSLTGSGCSQKIALNKLMARLNQMSEKVYNAAMLSVRSKQTKQELKPEASFAMSYDSKCICM